MLVYKYILAHLYKEMEVSDEVKKVRGGYKGYDGIYCSDLESTGLLHHLIEQGDKAKLHNCAMEVNQDKMYLLHTDTKESKEKVFRDFWIEILY